MRMVIYLSGKLKPSVDKMIHIHLHIHILLNSIISVILTNDSEYTGGQSSLYKLCHSMI